MTTLLALGFGAGGPSEPSGNQGCTHKVESETSRKRIDWSPGCFALAMPLRHTLFFHHLLILYDTKTHYRKTSGQQTVETRLVVIFKFRSVELGTIFRNADEITKRAEPLCLRTWLFYDFQSSLPAAPCAGLQICARTCLSQARRILSSCRDLAPDVRPASERRLMQSSVHFFGRPRQLPPP